MKLPRSINELNHYYSRFLPKIACRVGGSFGKPTEVIVLLTNRCNARCLHCHSWKFKQNGMELITESICQLELLRISIAGKGYPGFLA